jgi:hypothetical protein
MKVLKYIKPYAARSCIIEKNSKNTVLPESKTDAPNHSNEEFNSFIKKTVNTSNKFNTTTNVTRNKVKILTQNVFVEGPNGEQVHKFINKVTIENGKVVSEELQDLLPKQEAPQKQSQPQPEPRECTDPYCHECYSCCDDSYSSYSDSSEEYQHRSSD